MKLGLAAIDAVCDFAALVPSSLRPTTRALVVALAGFMLASGTVRSGSCMRSSSVPSVSPFSLRIAPAAE